MIPIYKPYLPKKSIKYAEEALSSGWVSSIGKYKSLATDKIKEMTGCKNVILLSNGTCAVHLCAIALKFKYPKIKNIVTSNNVYIAAVNGFLYDRENWKITVKDPDIETWNMKYSDIVNCPETAYLIVNNIGNIFNVPRAKILAPDSVFIEDNCEGFGGKYGNSHSGTESFCSSMSFFGNKNITCGEGGALYTNDDETFEYVTKVHGQGQTKERYIHDVLGYNYRMTNVQAGILLGQLECFDEIKEMKNIVFENFRKGFDLEGIQYQKTEIGTSHSNWFFGVTIPGSTYSTTEKILLSKGIDTRPIFYPLSKHMHLKDKMIIEKEDNASIINESSFMIPSYPELSADEISYIIKCVSELKKETSK
jgi:perosamine synthetase